MNSVSEETEREETQHRAAGEQDAAHFEFTRRHDDVADWDEVDEAAYDPTRE